MKAGFIQVTREVLPKARIIIDYFNVIQDVNRRFYDARRLVREPVRRVINKHFFLKASERLSDDERAKLRAYLETFPLLLE